MAADADKIPTEATVWLARLERGLLPHEGVMLREWLRQPAHRAAIVDAAKLWHGPDIIAVLAQLVPVGFGNPPPPQPKHRRQLVNVLIAIFGVLVTLVPMAYFQHPTPGVFAAHPTPLQRGVAWGESVYTTRAGETRIVSLPDNSTVTLNGHSRLGVLFSAASRLAMLEYGEAIFRTAPERRPFELNAGGRYFVASPSLFDVRVIREQALELTVITGAVTIRGLSWHWPATPAQARLFDPKVFADTTVGSLQAASLEDAALSRYPITAAVADARLRWQPDQVIYVTP
ncbi:MAG TPA: FecR domain-containing protein [Steroidobacteraceae bacterium]